MTNARRSSLKSRYFFYLMVPGVSIQYQWMPCVIVPVINLSILGGAHDGSKLFTSWQPGSRERRGGAGDKVHLSGSHT